MNEGYVVIVSWYRYRTRKPYRTFYAGFDSLGKIPGTFERAVDFAAYHKPYNWMGGDRVIVSDNWRGVREHKGFQFRVSSIADSSGMLLGLTPIYK
jgi:hypothetical protein